MFNKPHGKHRGIDRHIDLGKDIRQCADMVLVAMCDHKSFHLLLIFDQIGHIRDHFINSQHIIIRKRYSAVDDDNGIVILHSSNIHADLIKSPKGNDLHPALLFFCCFIQIIPLSSCSPQYFK